MCKLCALIVQSQKSDDRFAPFLPALQFHLISCIKIRLILLLLNKLNLKQDRQEQALV